VPDHRFPRPDSELPVALQLLSAYATGWLDAMDALKQRLADEDDSTTTNKETTT
jgi:hypothetical protein